MSDSNRTCEYVLDPDDPETWGGEQGDVCYVDEEILNEDRVWTCPHEAEGDSELCIFHLSVTEKDSDTTNKKLVDMICDREGDDWCRFIAAEFGEVSLNEYDISVNTEPDFSHANFRSSSNWSGVEFNQGVRFSGANFHKSFISHRTKYNDVSIFNGAEFFSIADFRYSTFEQDSYFNSIDFKDNSSFSRSNFYANSNFKYSDFFGEAHFWDANFHADADFEQVDFYKNVYFQEVEFRNSVKFQNTNFSQKATFEESVCKNRISFEKSNFSSTVIFEMSDFSKASFNHADLTDSDFRNTILQKWEFESALLSRAILFGSDLRGAKLNGAVLGDVRIDEDTQFLGHPDDDRDYSPHTFSAIRSKPCCVYDPNYEEVNDEADVDKAKSVYRALEELAGKAARPRLQSQCFVRRQDLQKEGYKQDAKEAESWQERLIAGARYSRAKVARGTLLYGESPWRIIGGSIGFIFLVALLYPLGEWLRPVGGEAITYSRILGGEWGLLLESLYFSTLTFTTLGMGDYEPMGFGQVLATLNTALGAVLIALLVFVLGRRAAR